MDFSIGLVVAGLLVGFVVGLTGMGGGALMTPILIFFFKIDPLTAIGSDLVVSLFMKPVGASVHLRRGTVNLGLVKWLCIGSVPGAFLGVFIVNSLGNSDTVQGRVKTLLGAALLLSVATMLVKAVVSLRQHYRDKAAGIETVAGNLKDIIIKPVPTVLIGLLGGIVVGMTSVGSGSLIIVGLLLLYPVLRANKLVGTDLVQAVPLVAAAALGHILVGNFSAATAGSLIIGAIPGVYLGARVSSRSESGFIRRALMFILLASGLKLINVPPGMILAALALFLVAGPVVWALVRSTEGFSHSPQRQQGVSLWRLVIAAGSGVPPRYQQGQATEPAGEPSGEPSGEPAAAAPAREWDREDSAADPL